MPRSWVAVPLLALLAACTAAPTPSRAERTVDVAATTPSALPVASPAPSLTLTERQTSDRPDDHDGYQVHVLYVLPSDGTDEQLDTNGWMATAVGSALRWFEKETGGRRLSIDTFRGELDITFVRLRRADAVVSAYDSRTGTSREPLVRVTLEVELRALGFDHPRKLYAVYYGGGSDSGECFGGAFPPSRVGTIGIANVKRGTRCEQVRNLVYPDGTYAIATANLHELFHALGAVGECAPHHGRRTASGDYEGIPGVRWTPGHVTDDPLDLMYPMGSRTQPPRFDAGRDDYFGHGKPGCLDLARSPFVLPAAPDAELPPLWPVGAARPRDCAEEATIGRAGSGARAGIVFDNMSDAATQLFLLTPQGRNLRDTIRPWIASYQRDAVAGSAWLAADASGKCLAIFVAEGTWTRASIRAAR